MNLNFFKFSKSAFVGEWTIHKRILLWNAYRNKIFCSALVTHISFPCDDTCSHAQWNSYHSGGFVKDIQSCPVMCVCEQRAEICSFQRESIYPIDHYQYSAGGQQHYTVRILVLSAANKAFRCPESSSRVYDLPIGISDTNLFQYWLRNRAGQSSNLYLKGRIVP